MVEPGAVAPADPGGQLPVGRKQRVEVNHRREVTAASLNAGRLAPAATKASGFGSRDEEGNQEGKKGGDQDPYLDLDLPLSLGGL